MHIKKLITNYFLLVLKGKLEKRQKQTLPSLACGLHISTRLWCQNLTQVLAKDRSDKQHVSASHCLSQLISYGGVS